jgi:hypothetical protein
LETIGRVTTTTDWQAVLMDSPVDRQQDSVVSMDSVTWTQARIALVPMSLQE